MTDDIHEEDYPSNSMGDQEKRSRSRAKKPVPIRPEPENSGGSVPENKRTIPVAKISTPRVRKQSWLSKVRDSIFGGDRDSVGHYVVWEVLIPAAKDTVKDMVTNGIEMLLYGTSTGRNVRRRGSSHRSSGTIVSYGSYYRNQRSRSDDHRERYERTRSSGYAGRVKDIVFDYEESADQVIEILIEAIERYGQVSVADFYETADVKHLSEYTDHSWGWTHLDGVRIVRVRDGFEIALPEPVRLD